MNAVVDTNEGGSSLSAEGVGQSLRRLRESQGKSVAEISARVKFSVRQVEALENERWDELPKGLSLRGLIRNYARMLDTDAEALIAALAPHIGAVQSDQESPLADSPARVPLYQDPEASASWGWIVVILAVLGVAVVYALTQGWLPQIGLPTGWFADATAS